MRRCWPHCKCLGCGATASAEGGIWVALGRGWMWAGHGKEGDRGARPLMSIPDPRSQWLQEREETAHRPEQGGESEIWVRGPRGGWGIRLSRPRTSYLTLLPQDFVEICKREGGDPEEKGVDRLLGLGSARLG